MDVQMDRFGAHRAIIAIDPDATGRLAPAIPQARPSMRRSAAMIWMLRHGEAEDSADDDASRRLTAQGERQARAAGAALASARGEARLLPASPRLRALETARIAAASLEVEVEVSEVLAGGDFDLAELVAGRGEILLVGHEPDFSRAVQLVTGARIKLERAGSPASTARPWSRC